MRIGTYTMLLALGLTAVFGFGCISQTSEDRWPQISFNEATYDFGDVEEAQVVEHTFTVTNNGAGVLRLIEVTAKSMSVIVYPLHENILPGQSSKIHVLFDTEGRWGKQKQTIIVATNEPDRLLVPLTLTGVVHGDFHVKPRILRAKIGNGAKAKATGTVTIKNTSGKTMRLTDVRGDNRRIQARFASSAASVTLAKHETVSIDVEFRPDLARKEGLDEVLVSVQGRERPIKIPVRLKR